MRVMESWKGAARRAVPVAVVGAMFALGGLAALAGAFPGEPKKGCVVTPEDPQVVGLGTFVEYPAFTIGETIHGYTPPGILDGIGAFKGKGDKVRLFVNHELPNTRGYAYTLKNGASLVGARVSYFDVDRKSLAVCDAGLAYDTMYNRAGDEVTAPADLEGGGLNRLCSANGVEKGKPFGFKDDIFFTGEESSGGTEWALDVKRGELWAVPAMGRAAWESVTPLDTGDKDTVALLAGDDRGGAPLLLYVGDKGLAADGTKATGKAKTFLTENGLAHGRLYVWVEATGDGSPADWNGTGTTRSGLFVQIDHYRPDLAGNGDYDALGYATQAKQDALAAAAGAFRFSRPEDVSTNPADPTVAVLCSTGLDGLFPDDSWGTIYVIDVDFSDLSANIAIAYDGDDAGLLFADSDDGIRSPDNVDWADDGYLYVNEDRSIGAFGLTSGEEASVWRLSPDFPNDGDITRIAQMNRAAGLPGGQTDPVPGDIGNWETSGVLDVTRVFGLKKGARLLVLDVQAHSVKDGSIGGSSNLVEGGQLTFLLQRTGGEVEME